MDSSSQRPDETESNKFTANNSNSDCSKALDEVFKQQMPNRAAATPQEQNSQSNTRDTSRSSAAANSILPTIQLFDLNSTERSSNRTHESRSGSNAFSLNDLTVADSGPVLKAGKGEKQSAPQDKFVEVPVGKDGQGEPGDNNVRDIDPKKDNAEAVTKRYTDMVDSLNLPKAEADRMKEQFGKDMSKMQDRLKAEGKGDDMSHVMRAMNLMMDSTNRLGNDSNRVNAVAGLAARGADPREANRQGENPTCAATSQARIEQQRDFAKYADQMGSIATRGGAWRAGQNGEKPLWVDIDQAGTNHANLKADRESSQMYNPTTHQTGGHRDYLGQLQDALIGGEMAHYAGQKDGKDYVYVTANGARAGAELNQGTCGGALMIRGMDGKLSHNPESGASPPAKPEIVAQMNHANGGGGLFMNEQLANKFRREDGSLPPGMNSFKDAADLRKQLKELEAAGHKGDEYQILTNGRALSGKDGHDYHAQSVSLNDKGQLVMGNNWKDGMGYNGKGELYSDEQINKIMRTEPVPEKPAPENPAPENPKPEVGPLVIHSKFILSTFIHSRSNSSSFSRTGISSGAEANKIDARITAI